MIDKVMKICHEYNPQWHDVASKITWEVNNNLKRTLGKAFLKIFKIEISGDHLANTPDSVLYDTVSHELAHIVAYHIYKDAGHGWLWRKTHMALGGNGKRCAGAEIGYNVRRNVVKRIIVERNGKEAMVTLTRWNRERELILMNGYKYVRTIQRDNGVETVIHTAPKPSQAIVTLFGDLVAAQSSK